MSTLGNIIWFVFGGVIIFIEYIIASLLLCITIVGIPFGLQTLKMAGLTLWPFGKEVVTVPHAGGCLYLLMNILWLVFGGIWICLTHLFFGIFFAITIIGIPFAIQHFKLAALSLTPFGKELQ